MLTDTAILEIAEQLTWYDADVERIDPMQFARAIEAKIMQKLWELGWFQEGVEAPDYSLDESWSAFV